MVTLQLKKSTFFGNIHSINPFYLIIGKADGYIEENRGNKYLVFPSTYGNKKTLAKFTKLWHEIKHLTETKKVSMKKIS